MNNFKNKFNNNKEKVVGEVKENIGKVTGNETLELKGKIKSTKADINKKLNKDSIENKIDDIKENVAKKINNLVDNNKQ